MKKWECVMVAGVLTAAVIALAIKATEHPIVMLVMFALLFPSTLSVIAFVSDEE